MEEGEKRGSLCNRRAPLLVLCDGDHGLRGSKSRQGRLYRQHAVFAQGGLDALGVRALGQQELSVVLTVHALAV